MAIPHRLARKLHEIFGIEAAEAMADWMNGIDGGQAELHGDIAELRHEMQREFARFREAMRAESSAFREEMRAESSAFREEMRAESSAFREEMQRELSGFREEMRIGFAALRREIAVSKVDVLKWAIGSWIASLALIAALIRFAH